MLLKVTTVCSRKGVAEALYLININMVPPDMRLLAASNFCPYERVSCWPAGSSVKWRLCEIYAAILLARRGWLLICLMSPSSYVKRTRVIAWSRCLAQTDSATGFMLVWPYSSSLKFNMLIALRHELALFQYSCLPMLKLTWQWTCRLVILGWAWRWVGEQMSIRGGLWLCADGAYAYLREHTLLDFHTSELRAVW